MTRAAAGALLGLLLVLGAGPGIAVAAPPDTRQWCERPSDCGVDGVCVAGRCRVGWERGLIEELHAIAVPAVLPLGAAPWLRDLAARATEQLRADLEWTGFYGPVDPRLLPAGHLAEGLSPTELDREAWQAVGAWRVVRASVLPTGDPGSVRLRIRALGVETYGAVDLPSGDVVVPPGGLRGAVAAWVNALVAYDTGLPASVGTRVVASVRVRPGVKEVVVLDCDGGALSFVTANGSLNLHPAWGPGGRVGYMSYASGNPDWMVDGVPLSRRPGLNASGSWSPDGKLLALTVAEGANSDVVLLDARTGRQTRRLTSHRAVDTSPVWSPDGRHLAFVSDRTGSPQIWRIAVDGSDLERLSSGGYVTSPAWSPLGDSLVYAQRSSGGFVLMRLDLASRRVRRISSPGGSADSPAFSPDGRLVIYARDPGDGTGQRLWTVRIDGRDNRPVPTPDWALFSPDWQAAPR